MRKLIQLNQARRREEEAHAEHSSGFNAEPGRVTRRRLDAFQEWLVVVEGEVPTLGWPDPAARVVAAK